MSADPISRDREKGWVLEDGKRLVTFRLKTFRSYENRLISLVGGRIGEMLLYQMGNEIGRTAFEYSREAIRSEADLGTVLDSVLSARGWGRCGPFQKQDGAGKVIYVVQLTGTPSSDSRIATKPSCHIERGLVAGYLEAYSGKKVQSHSESSCVVTGGQFCTFEIVLNS